MIDPVKAYKDLNECWNISAIINDMEISVDAEIISDLFRISGSLITTIESQKEEIKSANHLCEAEKMSKEYAWMLNKQMNEIHSENLLQINSLKAITELAVKGLESVRYESVYGHINQRQMIQAMHDTANSTLLEIARLTHEMDK